MKIPDGGIDIFYIDESMDSDFMAISAVTIPFVRAVEGNWEVVWEDYVTIAKDWRRQLRAVRGVPTSKELKGRKLLSGRGRYRGGKANFTKAGGAAAYASALQGLAWLPRRSILTAVGTPAANLYGHTRLQALLFALFQRMRIACAKGNRMGMVFFDEGHGEYRTLYRKARVYLPTGSKHGDWGAGKATKNLPLDNFVKDGNVKDSKASLFIQIADLVAFAALLKVRGEQGKLEAWQAGVNAGALYDQIPGASLNELAHTPDPRGIIRLG